MENIFFNSWESLGKTFVMTVLAYFSLIFVLRISGKRTLSKMNAFDFIVTVALGSSLATVALNKSIAIADGILAFFLLVFLQYLITWLSVRYKPVKKIVTSQPAMLLYQGELLKDRMKKERVTLEEILVVARQKGIADLDDLEVVVLETTGDITVIPRLKGDGKHETLKDVENFNS